MLIYTILQNPVIRSIVDIRHFRFPCIGWLGGYHSLPAMLMYLKAVAGLCTP
jgi:hypothetical protein